MNKLANILKCLQKLGKERKKALRVGERGRVKGKSSDNLNNCLCTLYPLTFALNGVFSLSLFIFSQCLVFELLIFNSAFKALAIPARVVYSIDAQNVNSKGVDLKVWSGYGLTINFIPTGEVIQQVWIGDPSRIGFTSNGNLCQRANGKNENTECTSSSATVLFLRQIRPVSFPNMTNSGDGSTQITVITSGDGGQKQYQFKLTPAKGQPAYTSLIIKPDSEKPAPLLIARTQPAVTTKKSSSPEQQIVTSAKKQDITVTRITPTVRTLVVGNTLQRSDANALAYGLAIAKQKGTITPGSTTWKKAQDAIRLLRQGKSREESISRSGVDTKVFNQLIEWGRTP